MDLEADDARGARDDAWLAAFELARRAVRTLGQRCVACGGYLWSRAGTAVYCGGTACQRRQQSRRERYRQELREHDVPCVLCGDEPT